MNGKTELRFRIAFGATLLASATMAATTWNVSPELTDGMTGAQQITNAVIRAANGDTISLAAGTYDMTGVFMKEETYKAGKVDGADVHVRTHVYTDKTLHFVGASTDHWDGQVKLTGNGRFFFATQRTESTFKHLTFDGFQAADNWQTQLYDVSKSASVGNDNNACAAGAVVALGGVATNCVFMNCRAWTGGAAAKLTTWDCRFYKNVAGRCGGAGFNITPYGCLFEENEAKQQAGAIWWPVTGCADCTFVGNTAAGDGGAVLTAAGNVIERCTFSNNVSTANNGGAVQLRPQTKILSCRFENNAVEGKNCKGGAVYGANSSDNQNGGREACFRDCVFIGNHAPYGGAVYDGQQGDNSPAALSGCAFSNNYATVLAGALYSGAATNCVFFGNYAKDGNGGAVASESQSAGHDLYRCTFTSNYLAKATSGSTVIYGAAVYEGAVGTRVDGCVFEGNYSKEPNAGHIFQGKSLIVNCAFTNNYSRQNGLVRFATCSNTVFFGNESIQNNGGILFGGTAIDCSFVGNKRYDTFYKLVTGGTDGAPNANVQGGDARESTLVRCDLDGGILYHCYLQDCHIHDCTNIGTYCVFYGNNVATNCLISNIRRGSHNVTKMRGIWYNWTDTSADTWGPGRAEFVNCTFADCESNPDGAYLASFYTTVKDSGLRSVYLANCLFYNNRLRSASGELADLRLHDENGLCTISYTNCVFGVAPSLNANNKGTFVDLGGNRVIAPEALGILKGEKAAEKGVADYTLRYGSPARGLGDASIWGETATDLAGNLRVRDGKVDPGCYECWLDPVGVLLLLR